MKTTSICYSILTTYLTQRKQSIFGNTKTYNTCACGSGARAWVWAVCPCIVVAWWDGPWIVLPGWLPWLTLKKRFYIFCHDRLLQGKSWQTIQPLCNKNGNISLFSSNIWKFHPSYLPLRIQLLNTLASWEQLYSFNGRLNNVVHRLSNDNYDQSGFSIFWTDKIPWFFPGIFKFFPAMTDYVRVFLNSF